MIQNKNAFNFKILIENTHGNYKNIPNFINLFDFIDLFDYKIDH